MQKHLQLYRFFYSLFFHEGKVTIPGTGISVTLIRSLNMYQYPAPGGINYLGRRPLTLFISPIPGLSIDNANLYNTLPAFYARPEHFCGARLTLELWM